jgi:DNA-binding response OmpR family regulator
MPARVLVVEDDAAIRRLVSEVLADAGYAVAEAADGAAALRVLDPGDPFALVVLDMRLPLVDGWSFAEQMRARGMDFPLLVMTAGREARRLALEVRAVGYVGKPFDIDELERAVRAALEGHGRGLLRAAFIPALPAILRGRRRPPQVAVRVQRRASALPSAQRSLLAAVR